MTQAIQCPGCGQRFGVPPQLLGAQVPCPACGGMLQIPAPTLTPLAPASPLQPWAPPPAPTPSASPLPPASLPPRKPAASAPRGRPAPHAVDASRHIVVIAVVGGVLAMGALVVAAVMMLGHGSSNSLVAGAGGSRGLFDGAPIPVPQFPDLGQPRLLQPSGAAVYFVDTDQAPGNDRQTPGMSMRLRVYLPAGEHPAKSLGCVLVAPAGTTLLHGCDMDDDDYHDETLPYVEAGMAVVFYSLDGPSAEMDDEMAQVRAMSLAYPKFRAARAGVINGRNALEFVLAKLPQVDPARISCAGHSSAATLSLLLAAHEPRLRAAIAYAPVTDLDDRLGDLARERSLAPFFPDVGAFIHDSSPKTHAAKIRGPLFLFHARDDSNEPFASTSAFAEQLRGQGANVTFSIADRGDHYQSMIDEGIPRAVEWLRQQGP